MLSKQNNLVYSDMENPNNPQTETEEVLVADSFDEVSNSPKVILFNDDWHEFEEVVNQIIKAIKCDLKKAEEMTWEVHTKGKAIVFDGELDECLKVSAILEEIKLHTQIEF